MGIYTKTGDAGQTSLGSGGRGEKDHPIVEACGMLDELSSLVGLLATYVADKTLLTHVQCELFAMGSYLTTEGTYAFHGDTAALEAEIDRMTGLLPPLHSFILPGGGRRAAVAHRCRAVCRTAERRVCAAAHTMEVCAVCIPFLNRLSDYFFVFARYLNHLDGVNEEVWTAEHTSL